MCAEYNLQCTDLQSLVVCRIEFTVHSLQCTFYSVQCAKYSLQCTNLQSTAYRILFKCTFHNVRCTNHILPCKYLQRLRTNCFINGIPVRRRRVQENTGEHRRVQS